MVSNISKSSIEPLTEEKPELLEINNKWAILIGVNNYDDSSFRDLKYSVNDINALYKILVNPERGNYIPDNINILSDSENTLPSRNIILSKLFNVSRSAGSDDSILFYFSGHGCVKNEKSYLLCKDSYNNTIEETAIRIELIKNTLADSLARVKILILDSCHSGAIKGVKDSGIMTKNFYDSIFPPPEGFIVLTSCKLNEYSYEWEEKEHGVFSYYLIEGLEGNADYDEDGLITLTDTYKYAFENVKKWAFSRGFEQSPTLEARIVGYIPFVYSKEVLKKEEKIEFDLINEITLIGTDYVHDYEVKSMIHGFLGSLLNYIDFDDIKRKTEHEYTFSDGSIEINNYPDPDGIYELLYYPQVKLVINKDNIEIQDKIVFTLANEFEWEKITFKLKRKIDFNGLYNKCIENMFKIIEFEPTEEEQMLKVDTKGWAETTTIFKNINNTSTIEIKPKNNKKLKKDFYEILNQLNINEFFKDIIK